MVVVFDCKEWDNDDEVEDGCEGDDLVGEEYCD